MKIEFGNAKDLKLMLQVAITAASTDEEHAALNGVCLEVRGGNVWALATDGRWAVRIRHDAADTDENDAGFRFRVPLDDCKAALGLIGSCEHPATFERDDTMARLEVNHRGHLEWHWTVEIESPDVFSVWPEETADVAYLDKIGLSPTLLAKIGKAFALAADDSVPLKFAFHGTEQPISVTAQTLEPIACDAIVMPTRLEDDSKEDPRQGKLFDEQTQSSLDDLVERTGATVTVQVPGQKPVRVGRRSKKAEP